MRVPLLLISLVLVTRFAHADMGVTYCMKASVKFKNGTFRTGYFLLGSYNLRLEKAGNAWQYQRDQKSFQLNSQSSDPIRINKGDSHFHQFVLQELMDKTRLYSDVVLLRADQVFPNTYDRIPVVIEPATVLDKVDITSLIVQEVYFTMPTGTDTHLRKEDRQWLMKKIVQTESLGSATLCEYSAIFFKERTEKVNELVVQLKALYSQSATLADDSENFSQEEYDALQASIQQKVEALRKMHVLILSSCSC